MDLWQWLTLAGAVMLSGISKTSFAGSLGLLAMPLLLQAFPADRALALLLPVLILCDAFTLQSSWNKWDLTALRFLLLPAIIGIVAASFVLLLVTIQQLQLFIGIGATLFALRYFLWQCRFTPVCRRQSRHQPGLYQWRQLNTAARRWPAAIPALIGPPTAAGQLYRHQCGVFCRVESAESTGLLADRSV